MILYVVAVAMPAIGRVVYVSHGWPPRPDLFGSHPRMRGGYPLWENRVFQTAVKDGRAHDQRLMSCAWMWKHGIWSTKGGRRRACRRTYA